MVTNIKTEIIYYCGPTDFEFEFNLCGSCQMRLLTSTANDNASLLKALQRGISRSRVILIIGKLCGEDSIINLVSKSIGYTCEKIDTDVYEINSQEDLVIVKDSVPLITDSGEFGGCIIESGPQSMIFLSDDKKIRKEIMTNLVHGYIKDLSQYPIQAAAKSETPVFTEPVSQEETVIPETPEIVEEINEEVKEEIEEVIEEELIPEETQEKVIVEEVPITEPEEDPYNINNLMAENITESLDFNSDDVVYEDDEYDTPQKIHYNSTKALDILSLILSVIFLLTLAFMVYSFIYIPFVNEISIEENFINVFRFLFG